MSYVDVRCEICDRVIVEHVLEGEDQRRLQAACIAHLKREHPVREWLYRHTGWPRWLSKSNRGWKEKPANT